MLFRSKTEGRYNIMSKGVLNLSLIFALKTTTARNYSFVKAILRGFMRAAAPDSPRKLLNMVWEAYSKRGDIGHSAASQHDLFRISTIFPGEKTIFANLLRAGVYGEIPYEGVEFIIKTAANRILNEPDIQLLLIFQRIKHKKFANAASDLLALPQTAFDTDPVLQEIWRISSIHLIVNLDTHFFTKFSPPHFVKVVETEPHPNVVFDILINMFNSKIGHDLFLETIKLLANTNFQNFPETFAVVYNFLVACGYPSQAKALEEHHGASTNDALHPLYIRSKLGPLRISDDIRLVPMAELERASGDERNWRWRNADLERIEIAKRVDNFNSAPNALGKFSVIGQTHVLIAFFGQMRFPSFTLPRIRNWVEENFVMGEAQVEISYGVSTWEETGSKLLDKNDDFSYMSVYLPREIREALSEIPLSRVSDAIKIFPKFSSALLKQLSQISNVVNEDEIRDLLSTDVFFDISNEDAFVSEIGSYIAEFAEGQNQVVNQGRMIDRIGSIETIIEKIEEKKNPITHVLFIRPDLYNLSGSLRRHFDHMINKKNWLLADEDPVAQFIEGVGDRMMLADRQASYHVIGMKQKLRRIFREIPRNDLVCSRISAHQMLGATLFENSVEVRTLSKSDVDWSVFRGNFESMEALTDLKNDILGLNDFHLRTKLNKAMRELHY